MPIFRLSPAATTGVVPSRIQAVSNQTKTQGMPERSTNSSTSEEQEEDVISSAIGEFGRWQLLLTFILSLVNIPCTWHIFVPTFHARERDFLCVQPQIGCQITDNPCFLAERSVVNDSCLDYSQIKCENWEFKGEGSTITSEFNLVCDRKTLINLAEMMFLAGVAVGGLVSGIISDKYGRKKTLLTSISVQCILGTLIAFAPWFELYVVLRCLLGFFSVSVVFSGFVLAIELVGGHWRTITGISYLFPVSLGYCTISGMAYLLDNWRHLQLALSLPGTLFLLSWFILPESPRWLLALGRTKEVIEILEKAAKFNKKTLPNNLDKSLMPIMSNEQQENKNKVGVGDLFKTANMRKKTLILFLIWFGVYLVYYGLVLNLGNLGGDLYINSVLMGVVEVPAVALSILILVKGGRRWPLALTMIVSGIFAGLAIPVSWISDELQWLITTFTMISKFCISSSNVIMPVYTAELYPTIIRNIGVGAANVPAGIALMLVPYLWNLSGINGSLPWLVISIFGIVGGASVLLLPETGASPLADTLDSNEVSKRSSQTSNNKKMNNNHCT